MAHSSKETLAELGKKLVEQLELPATKDSLLKRLKLLSDHLALIDQSAPDETVQAMEYCKTALIRDELVQHKDKEVRLQVALCASEIMRIEAPNVPYDDETLKMLFELIVGTFRGLDDMKSPSFHKRVHILDTFASVKSCVLMLDLDCDTEELVLTMFRTFFQKARIDHSREVLDAMQNIMALVVHESDEGVLAPLVVEILTHLTKKKKDSAAKKLAAGILRETAGKLETQVLLLLTTVHEGKPHVLQDHYHDIILEVYRCAPGLLSAYISNLKAELMDNNLEVRTKTLQLLGKLFSVPGQVPKEFRDLVPEFAKRFKDTSPKVRLAAIDSASEFVLSNNAHGLDLREITNELQSRVLDHDDTCRIKALTLICDAAKLHPESVSNKVLEAVACRLRDNKPSVRAVAMQKLTDVYATYCSKTPVNFDPASLDWIPVKIIKAVAPKMFRLQAIETILSEQLFSPDLSLEEKAQRWIAMFFHFQESDLKVLEKILLLKQRFQNEMQNYLLLRQKHKKEEESHAELDRKIQACFKSMAMTFSDASKAQEHLEKLHQMRDSSIFKKLEMLLDPSTTYADSRRICDELLKTFGNKHPQYEFLKDVAIRCSYLLFGREHVAFVQKMLVNITDNKQALSAGLTLLEEFSLFFPSLMESLGEEIVDLLNEKEDDNVKEKALHILSKAGHCLRSKIADSRSSLDLTLETFCLEGTRKQAKYAVTAIASLSSDSGLKALSILYGHLLKTLKSKGHLATVLQSLGCIAQIAKSVFETRESDVVGFILEDLMLREPAESASDDDWESRSEECMLKIYGLKALVRSYLPVKDAQLRQSSLTGFLPLLLKLLKGGCISETSASSAVDKAHLRLAAAKAVLRLSRVWDKDLPAEFFRHTVFTIQDLSVQVREELLSKVYKCLKAQQLAFKYGCVYPLSSTDDAKRCMTEFIASRREIARLGHTELQNQPEYLLTYLIHLLAHHPEFPESPSEPTAYEPFYKHLFWCLQALLARVTDAKKEESTLSAVLKILRAIKITEDAELPTKSQNLYVLCDIALHIAKELGAKFSSEAYNGPVRLPVAFYKDIPEASAKDDGSDLPSMLTETVLDNFLAALTESPLQRKRGKKVEEASADEEDGNDDPPPKKSRKADTEKGTPKHRVRKGNEEGVTNMSEDDAEHNSQKRKRGRPSKEKQEKQEPQRDVPRKRGRPKGSSSKKPKLDVESPATSAEVTPAGKQEKTKSADSGRKAEKQERADAAGKRSKITPVRKDETENEDDEGDEPVPGRRVKVWWPDDKMFYNGAVKAYNPKTRKHKISYDDGDKETLVMRKERWEYIDNDEDTSPSPPSEPAKSKKKSSVKPEDEPRSSQKLKSSCKKRPDKKEASEEGQHHSENDGGRREKKYSKVNGSNKAVNGEVESSQPAASADASKGTTDTDDEEPLESYRSRMKKVKA